MNLSIARIIDESFGVILCLLLDGYNRVFRRFRNRSVTAGDNPRILVMKFWGMGSIVLAAPAIKAIRQHYPHAHITALSFAGNRTILEATGLIDEIVEINNTGILRFMIALPWVVAQLRRIDFDMVIDFEFFTRVSAIFSYLIGRRERVGFYEPRVYRGHLLTQRVMFDIDNHVSDNFLALVRAVGASGDYHDSVTLRVTDEGRKQVATWLQKVGVVTSEERLICINVNASELSLQRRWPPERFAEILMYLVTVSGVRPVLIGAPGDAPYVEKVKKLAGDDARILVAAGPLNVKGVLALLEQSILMITNDSGPLHFAVGLGIPTVSFFGPETPLLYGPIGDNHKVFYKEIYCNPCIHAIDGKLTRCTNPRCILAIKTADVIAWLKTFLKQERGGIDGK